MWPVCPASLRARSCRKRPRLFSLVLLRPCGRRRTIARSRRSFTISALDVMRRFISVCLALASVCLARPPAQAARPEYGGTLRVEIDPTIRSVDPAAAVSDVREAMFRRRALALVFEPLAAATAEGLRPRLATSWESDARGSRWQFRLRPGVRLHDGSTLETWQVAASLRTSEPAWTIAADGDTVVVNTTEPVRDLPWVLADLRHSIVVRRSGGAVVGTGPFQIDRLEPARLSLRAHDAYWAARPFVDAVRIDMGRARTVQLGDLEAGRADVVSSTPLDARRITQRGLQVASSRPVELFALVFEPHRGTDALVSWRRTLASAINRGSICSVLLQRLAEPAEALVPGWISGYAPLFARDPKPTLTRPAIAALPLDQREPTVRIDPTDPLAQAIADRIAVDAREAGFAIKIQAPAGLAPRPDVRLVRIGVTPTSPDRALAAAIEQLTIRDPNKPASALPPGAALETVYGVEQKLLDRSVIVPLVHLPEIYALSDRLAALNAPVVRPEGGWNFADVWLRSGTR
jgi:ABC-type transport system substrate-binding protein